eukprot:GFUD01024838.1.p1 GENE.GFUD01024838.1~~GFUD01024838.1.p1  ORF type:complete len:226 (+),score=32.44 GFUD01024838.1:80-757(+)
MESPEGYQRISVIHSGPSAICNPKLGEEPCDHDTLESPHTDERYDSSWHKPKESHSFNFNNEYDYQEIRRQEEQPNFEKSRFQGFYTQSMNSQLGKSPATNYEWNNLLHQSYLTSMANERNPNLAYPSPHHHKNKMPSHRISLNTFPYRNPQRGCSTEDHGSVLDMSSRGENHQSIITDRNRTLSGSSKSSNSSPNEKSCMLPETVKVIKLECPADLQEKVGNKP